MNINTINKNKIKISLTDEEVSSIFGGYDKLDYKDPDSKFKLDMLLNNIIRDKDFSLDSERLLIEVIQELSGCSIVLTKIYEKNAKRYKKLVLKGRIAHFDTVEDMIEGIIALYNSNLNIKKSDLYLLDKKYRLIIYTATPSEHLGEYCKNITNKQIYLNYTEEYGTPLCIGDAVNILGKTFSGH